MVKLKNLLSGSDEFPIQDGTQETLTSKVEHSDAPYENYSTPVADFTSPLELDNYTKAVIAHHGEVQALKEAVYMKRLLESLNNNSGENVFTGGGDTPDNVIINQNNGNGGEYMLPNLLLGKYVSLGDSPYDAIVVKVKPNGEMVLQKTYNVMNVWDKDNTAREMADAFLEQIITRNNGDISGLHGFLNTNDPEYVYKVAKTLNEKYFGEGKIKELADKKEKLLLIEQDLKKNNASKDRIEAVKKSIENIDETIAFLYKGGYESKIGKSLIDANKFSQLITQTDNIITDGYDNTLKSRGVVVNVEKYINETKKNNDYLLEEYFKAKAGIINNASQYITNPDDKEFFANVTPSLVKDVYNKMLSGTVLNDEERKVSQFLVGLSDDLSVLSEVSRHKALQNSFEAISDYLGWSNRNKTLQRGIDESGIMWLIDPEVKMSKKGKNYGASYWHVGLQEGEHKTYSGIAIGGTFADKRDGAIESLIRGIGQGLITTSKVGLFLTGLTGLNRVYHDLGLFNTLDKISPVGSELAERSLYSSDPYEPTWNFSWDKMMNLTGNFTVDLATSFGAGAIVKGLLLGGGRQLAKYAAKKGATGVLSAKVGEGLAQLATKEVSLLKGVPIIGKYGGRLSFPTIVGGGIIDGQEVWQEGANRDVNPFMNTLSTIATIGTVGVLENIIDIEGIGRGILGTKLMMADIPKTHTKGLVIPKTFQEAKQTIKDIKDKAFSKTKVDAIEDASTRDVFEATVHNTLAVDANAIMMAKAKGIDKERLFTETISENGVLTPKIYRLDKTEEALTTKVLPQQMSIEDFDKIAQGSNAFVKNGYLYRKTDAKEIEKIPLKEVNEYGLTAEEMAEAYKIAAERAKNKFLRYGLIAPYIKIGDKLFNNNASKFLIGSAMEGVTEVLQDISMYGIKSSANAIDLMMGLAVTEAGVDEIKDKVYRGEALTETEKDKLFRPGTYEAQLDFEQLVEAGVAGALMGGGANIVGGIRRGLSGKTPEKEFIERERAYKEMLAKNYGLDLTKEADKAELDKIYANSFNLARMVHLGLEEDYLYNLKKLVKRGFVTATQYAEQEKFINEYKVKNMLYGDAFNSAWNKLNYDVKSGATADIAKAIYMEKLRLKENLLAKKNRLERIQSYTIPNKANVDDFALSISQEKQQAIEQGNILDNIINQYDNGINNVINTIEKTQKDFIENRAREIDASKKAIENYYDTLSKNESSLYTGGGSAEMNNAHVKTIEKIKEAALGGFNSITGIANKLFLIDTNILLTEEELNSLVPVKPLPLFNGKDIEFSVNIKIDDDVKTKNQENKQDVKQDAKQESKKYTLGEYFGVYYRNGKSKKESQFYKEISNIKTQIKDLLQTNKDDNEFATPFSLDKADDNNFEAKSYTLSSIISQLKSIEEDIISAQNAINEAKEIDDGYKILAKIAETEVSTLLNLLSSVNNYTVGYGDDKKAFNDIINQYNNIKANNPGIEQTISKYNAEMAEIQKKNEELGKEVQGVKKTIENTKILISAICNVIIKQINNAKNNIVDAKNIAIEIIKEGAKATEEIQKDPEGIQKIIDKLDTVINTVNKENSEEEIYHKSEKDLENIIKELNETINLITQFDGENDIQREEIKNKVDGIYKNIDSIKTELISINKWIKNLLNDIPKDIGIFDEYTKEKINAVRVYAINNITLIQDTQKSLNNIAEIINPPTTNPNPITQEHLNNITNTLGEVKQTVNELYGVLIPDFAKEFDGIKTLIIEKLQDKINIIKTSEKQDSNDNDIKDIAEANVKLQAIEGELDSILNTINAIKNVTNEQDKIEPRKSEINKLKDKIQKVRTDIDELREELGVKGDPETEQDEQQDAGLKEKLRKPLLSARASIHNTDEKIPELSAGYDTILNETDKKTKKEQELSKLEIQKKELDETYASIGEAKEVVDKINALAGKINTQRKQFWASLNAINQHLDKIGIQPQIQEQAQAPTDTQDSGGETQPKIKKDPLRETLNQINAHSLFKLVRDKLLPDISNEILLLRNKPYAYKDTFYDNAYSTFIQSVIAKTLERKHTGQSPTAIVPIGEAINIYDKKDLLTFYDNVLNEQKDNLNSLRNLTDELNKVANDFYERRKRAYAKAEHAIDEVIKEYNEFIAPIEKMKEEVDKEIKRTNEFLEQGYSKVVEEIDEAIEASKIDELKNLTLSYLDPKEKDYYVNQVSNGLTKFMRYFLYQRNIENLNKALKSTVYRSGDYYSPSYMPMPAHQRYITGLREIIDNTTTIKSHIVQNALLEFYKTHEQFNEPVKSQIGNIKRNIVNYKYDDRFEKLKESLMNAITEYENRNTQNLLDIQDKTVKLLDAIESILNKYEAYTLKMYGNLFVKLNELQKILEAQKALVSVINNNEIKNILSDLLLADYELMRKGEYDEAIKNIKEKIYENINKTYVHKFLSGENIKAFVRSNIDYLFDDFSAALYRSMHPELLEKDKGFAVSEIVNVIEKGINNQYSDIRKLAEKRADYFALLDILRLLYKEALPSTESFNVIANAILRQNYDGMPSEYLLQEINLSDIDTIQKVLSEVELLLNTGKNKQYNSIGDTGKTIKGIINELQQELEVLKQKATNIAILKHNQSVIETKDTILHILDNIYPQDLPDENRKAIIQLLSEQYYTKKEKNGVIYYEINADTMKSIMKHLSNVEGMDTYFDIEKEYINSAISSIPLFSVEDEKGDIININNFPYNMQQRMNAFFYVYNMLIGKANYVAGLGGTGKTTSLKLAIEIYGRMLSPKDSSSPSVSVHFVTPNEKLLGNPAYTNYSNSIQATREMISTDESETYYKEYFNKVIQNASSNNIVIVIDELALFNNEIGKAANEIIQENSDVRFIYVSDIAQNKHPNNYNASGNAVITVGGNFAVGYPSNIIWRNANYGLSKAIQVATPKTYLVKDEKEGITKVVSEEKNKEQLINMLSQNLYISEDRKYGVEVAKDEKAFFEHINTDMITSPNSSFLVITATDTEAEELKAEHAELSNIIFPISQVQGTEADVVYFYTKDLSNMRNSNMFNASLYTGITRAKEKVVLSHHLFKNEVKQNLFSTENIIPQDMSFAIQQTILLNNRLNTSTDTSTNTPTPNKSITVQPSNITDFKKDIASQPITKIKDEEIANIYNEGVKTNVEVIETADSRTSTPIIPIPNNNSAIAELTYTQTARNRVFDLFSNALSILDTNDMIDVCQ